MKSQSEVYLFYVGLDHPLYQGVLHTPPYFMWALSGRFLNTARMIFSNQDNELKG